MFRLNDELILNYMEQDLIKIEPFERDNLYSWWYYFRLGDYGQIVEKNQKCHSFKLTKNEPLHVPPQGLAIIRAYETFKLDPKIDMEFGQNSNLGKAGFLMIHSNWADPSFEGILELELYNLFNRENILPYREIIGKLKFNDISDTPPSTIPQNLPENFKRRKRLKIPTLYEYDSSWKKKLETD